MAICLLVSHFTAGSELLSDADLLKIFDDIDQASSLDGSALRTLSAKVPGSSLTNDDASPSNVTSTETLSADSTFMSK